MSKVEMGKSIHFQMLNHLAIWTPSSNVYLLHFVKAKKYPDGKKKSNQLAFFWRLQMDIFPHFDFCHNKKIASAKVLLFLRQSIWNIFNGNMIITCIRRMNGVGYVKNCTQILNLWKYIKIWPIGFIINLMGIGNVQMDQNETIILQSYLKHLLILINSKILNKEVGHPT